MKKFCVMTPAIVDQECIEYTSKSLKKNLFDANPDVEFLHLVQLCDHKRPGCYGDVISIKEIYEKNSSENVVVDVEIASPRMGHTKAGYQLFTRFISANFPHGVIIEDDTNLMHKLSVDMILESCSKDRIIHLSMGYEDLSSENPFILPETIQQKEGYSFHKNSRNFCSWNGNIFSRDLMVKIVNDFMPFSRANCEDQISKMSCYQDLEVVTVSKGTDIPVLSYDDKSILWCLPEESHMLLEVFRRTRDVGRLGYLA